MRPDQRRPIDMRPVRIDTNYLLTAEGCALIEVGNTRVLCAASIEDTVPAFLRNSGKGWVTAEYSMLPRATATRTPREITKGRASGRTLEIQRLIGRSLRAVVDMNLLGAERYCRLRCVAGRWRNAHGIHYRSFHRAFDRLETSGRFRNSQVFSDSRSCRRDQRRHCVRRDSAGPLL